MTCCPITKSVVKLGALAAVGAGVVGLLGYNRTASYVSTGWTRLSDAAKSQVSPEFELDRIATQIAALDPDIDLAKTRVAELRVDLDALERTLADARANLTARKKHLQELTAAVEARAGRVSLNGRTFTADESKAKLARDLSAYELAEKELVSKQRLHDAKVKQFDAARELLGGLKRQREELSVVVNQLRADLKEAELAQTNSAAPIDDSRLADVKHSLGEVRRRIDVMKAKQNLNDNLEGRKEEPTTDELLRRAKEKVGEPAKDAVRAD